MNEITGTMLLEKLEAKLKEHYDVSDDIHDGLIPKEWELYPTAGLCYRDNGDGCVNQDSPIWDYDDVSKSIIEKFYQYYSSLRDALEERFPHPKSPYNWFKIMIEPSYEDTSSIVIFDTLTRMVVFSYDCKAWNFVWNSPEEMATSMKEDYDHMVKAVTPATEHRKEYIAGETITCPNCDSDDVEYRDVASDAHCNKCGCDFEMRSLAVWTDPVPKK